MKTDTPNHPKTLELAKRLGVPRYHAVGILESLWCYASRYAPEGDIGRFSDQTIAAAIDWDKDPALLVQLLIESRLVDFDNKYRLIIHDWPDHCNDNVHIKLARNGGSFANGKLPRSRKRRDNVATNPDFVGKKSENAALYIYNTTSVDNTENQEEKQTTLDVLSPMEAALVQTTELIYQRHPPFRRCGRGEISQLLKKIVAHLKPRDPVALLHQIDSNHLAWCATEDWSGEYTRGLSNWLAPTMRRYLDRPEGVGVRRVASRSEKSLRDAAALFEGGLQ